MAFDRSEEIEIETPLDRVFALVSDIRRHPEWAYNTLAVEHIDGPEVGEGAHYSSTVTGAVPGSKKAIKGDIKVTGCESPRLFVYECKDSAGTYRWTFHLYHRDTVCTATHTVERLEGPWYVVAMQPVMWAMVGRSQVRHGLAKLKALCEQPVEAPVEAPAAKPEAKLPRQRKATVELPTEERAGR